MTTARTTFTPATEGQRSWRLPLDEPTTPQDEGSMDMDPQTTQAQQQASPHLTAARQLLDEIGAATDGPQGDPQAKATAAAAHAILVLAEQVAAARLTMAMQHRKPEVKA